MAIVLAMPAFSYKCLIDGEPGHVVVVVVVVCFVFNDELSTFCLRLNGVRGVRGNSIPPHKLLFPISSKGSFVCISLRQNNTYHDLCYTRNAHATTIVVTPVVEHWLELEIAE